MKRPIEQIQMILYVVSIFLLALLNLAGLKQINAYNLKTKEKKETEKEETTLESFKQSINDSTPLTEKKYAYLTFDDGPSANTDKILDVLAVKGVKATFFVVGKTGEKAEERYQRIVEEGHSLGIHSYSHDYSEIYSSLENYKADILKLKDYLFDVTGEDVWLYRFPGGSSNSVAKIPIQECIAFLEEEGLTYFDWNSSSEDAVAVNVACSTLNNNVLKDALRFHNAVILMHDLHECNNTVEGLGTLIDRLLEEGYEIKPITRETTPVQHVKKTIEN